MSQIITPQDIELKERAEAATGKAAKYGADVNLARFVSTAPERAYQEDLTALTPEQKQRLLDAGVDPTAEGRSGTYVQMDHSVVHQRTTAQELEILAIDGAMKQYPWLADYWWRTVQVDTDKYTAQAELELNHGYFIRARPGAKSIYPLQACLFIGQDGLVQNVHNIILAEEDSELHIITGCAVDVEVKHGLHIGVSEMYVKRGAKVSFTMIHNWAEGIVVRPRTGVEVEEGGLFISNYVCLQPVRDLQTYPTVRLVGEGAVGRLNSVVVGTPGSHLDVGGRVLLEASNTRAEVIARTVSTGGEIIARGHLRGDVAGVKAHLECQGLMLSDEGSIYAVPELEGRVADVEMSHEAAVGKVAQEAIEYLMARGLNEEEATSTIVRGFLNVDIQGLPPALRAHLDQVIAKSQESLF